MALLRISRAKRALRILKRALCMYVLGPQGTKSTRTAGAVTAVKARALEILKRALHILRRALRILKEPYIFLKELYISSKEPYISSKEPYIS